MLTTVCCKLEEKEEREITLRIQLELGGTIYSGIIAGFYGFLGMGRHEI